MLRTLVLLVTHLSMLLAGMGLVLITTHARRQALQAAQRVADVRELFIEDVIAKREARINPPRATAGRHRAGARPMPTLTLIQPAVKPPSLLTASLPEAVAILATQRAQRAQDRRQFVDLMTSLVGPARIRTHAVGVAHVA